MKDRTKGRYQPKRLRHRPTAVEGIDYDGTPESAAEVIAWADGKFMLDDYGRLCALTPDGLRYVPEGGTAVLGVIGEPYMLLPEVKAVAYVELADGDYSAPLTIDRVRELVAESRTIVDHDRLREVIARLGAHSEALMA